MGQLYIFLVLFIISLPLTARGRLIELSDYQMEDISAQAGITIGISKYKAYRNFDYIGYKDTDTNGYIFLNNVEMVETLSTGNVDTNHDNLKTGIYVDVFVNLDSIPMVSWIADDLDHRFDFHAQDIDFCGHKIGSLDIDEIHPYSHRYYATGHSNGIDFEYNLGLEISNFYYKYQQDPQDPSLFKALHIGKVYMVGSFTQNPNDDPKDPTTWKGEGQFQFGDLNPYGESTYNPATLDIGIDQDTNRAMIQINLPMKGSFRIDSFKVGDKDFGPIAIDEIVVHHMKIRLIP